MKTCKDCYHFDACVDKLGTTKFYDNVIAANNVEDLCKTFKDASLVLDLPCAIDAEIFMLKDRYKGKKIVKTDIVKAHIVCFTIGEAKRVIADVCDEEGDFYIALGAEDFHLSYEAAEQALKECASNG